jgi:hypothetical protein
MKGKIYMESIYEVALIFAIGLGIGFYLGILFITTWKIRRG